MTTKQRALEFLRLATKFTECDSPLTAQRAIKVASGHLEEIIQEKMKRNRLKPEEPLNLADLRDPTEP